MTKNPAFTRGGYTQSRGTEGEPPSPPSYGSAPLPSPVLEPSRAPAGREGRPSSLGAGRSPAGTPPSGAAAGRSDPGTMPQLRPVGRVRRRLPRRRHQRLDIEALQLWGATGTRAVGPGAKGRTTPGSPLRAEEPRRAGVEPGGSARPRSAVSSLSRISPTAARAAPTAAG